ncbi:MAG: glycosyltransferase family 2 protein [Pyrinomonadaceae bacterium]|nr:glycosyltransferase family 2 protein [Pyrinomonadaceae bacterium]
MSTTDIKPLVSVGLPVYNGEKYVRRALSSLLAQDYENFELIVSDNASTDGSREICQEYAAKDSRIKLHAHQQNQGVVANFGAVLARARGPYFMWAAVDDRWMPGFVTALVKKLNEDPKAGVAMSAVERRYEDGGIKDVVRYTGDAEPSRMSNYRLAAALTAGSMHHLYIYGLFRTDFLRRAFCNYPQVKGPDRLFMTQIALATKFRYVDEILHVRQVSDAPLHVKFAGDEVGKAQLDITAALKKVLAAGPYLLKSRVIPWYRKLWGLLIVVIGLVVKYKFSNFILSAAYVLSGRLLGPLSRKMVADHIRRLIKLHDLD